ncbi:MAG: elongation factor Ts [Streptosporangiales bacterium]|nr:elongation factor Ts [Streptosporangiales bacterium]
MANFSAQDVKRLRQYTGAGMMDSKKALEEADGDFDAAVEVLRKKGAKDVGKRAERTAAQGLVTLHRVAPDSAVLLELNCETDFVAKLDRFQDLAVEIAAYVAENRPADVAALLSSEIQPGKTVQALIEETSATIGEKLELRRFAQFEGGPVQSYLHKSDPGLPPTLGVLVQLDADNPEVGTEIAQQIAALAPKYLSRDDVPEDVIANERRIAEEITRNEGKPEQAIPKIVEGRLGGFFKDVTLLEQPFVKDNKTPVRRVLSDAGVNVTRFVRFKVGQA